MKNTYSLITCLFVIAVIIGIALTFSDFQVLTWDTMGYHVYLTQWFVHHDMHIHNLEFYNHIQETYQNTSTLYQFVTLPNGEFITRYPYGWALLNLPFIIIGHIFAILLHYPVDGFSLPYQIAAYSSSLFYMALGIYWLRKVLLHFFSDKQTMLLIIAIILGTNYLHLNSETIGLIHVYLFSLYALLLLQTIKFYQTYQLKIALGIGFIIGLMVAARPTEIVAIFIPLLWGVGNFEQLKGRFTLIFKTHLKTYLLAMIVGGCIIFPQLLYWKVTTGEWIFYSYNNPGEGLDLLSPHTRNFLLSFRKGWWIYTPIMFFATLGFYTIYKKNRSIFWALFVYFIVNLYLISSWTTWWYASSFSQRAVMQSYPIMAITLGYFLFYGIKKKAIYGSLLILLVGFNLFQTYQYHKRILAIDRMTSDYYFSVFGQVTTPTQAQLDLLSVDRDQTEFKDYGNLKKYRKTKTIHYDGPKPFMLSEKNMYSKNIEIEYGNLTFKDHVWIRGIGIIEPQSSFDKYSSHFVMMMMHNREAYTWRNLPIQSKELAPHQKDTLIFDYLTPEIRSNSDLLSVGFWQQSGDSVLVDDFYFEVWEPIK